MSSNSALPTRRFQEKRDAILNAAAEQFNRHGIKGATLAGIAASVGLATNSVTYYYRKKEDLAAACFDRSIESLLGLVETALQEPTLAGRIHKLYAQYTALLLAIERGAHPPQVVFLDLRSLPSPHFEKLAARYIKLMARTRKLLQGPETASLSLSDLAARAYGILSLLHWTRAWIDRHDAREYQDIAHRISDILLRGCQSDAELWRPPCATELAWDPHPKPETPQEAFLRAASRLINAEGYRGASVEKISSVLNLTKGSFYHHHSHKDDVTWACFERTFEIVNRALDLADRSFGNGWARACAVTRTISRFQLSARGPLLRLAAITAVEDPERRAQALAIMNRLTMRQSSLTVDGIIDGSMRAMDANVAGFINAGVMSSTSVIRYSVTTVTESNVSELFVRPMMAGILCPASGIA